MLITNARLLAENKFGSDYRGAVQNLVRGELGPDCHMLVSSVMLPRETNPGSSQSTADSEIDASFVSQNPCGNCVEAGAVDKNGLFWRFVSAGVGARSS